MPLFGRKRQPAARIDPRTQTFTIDGITYPALGPWAYAPRVPTQFVRIPAQSKMEVVGESHYIDGIRRISDAMRAAGADTALGVFVAEPGNPHDNHAVRIDLLWGGMVETCGHLSREQAYRFQPDVKTLAEKGGLATMRAEIWGGTPGKPHFGVWLGGDSADFTRDRMRDARGGGQS